MGPEFAKMKADRLRGALTTPPVSSAASVLAVGREEEDSEYGVTGLDDFSRSSPR